VNDILKQRLVGALILVALGVIFWPIIFVEPDGADTVEPRSIPAPPGVSITPIDAPTDAGLRGSPALTEPEEAVRDNPPITEDIAPEQAGVSEPSTPPERATEAASDTPPDTHTDGRETRTESPEKLQMDSGGVPIAWTLQVATLSNAESAESLRQRLLALEHKAYIARVQHNGKTLYRVCIGPKFERAEIESLKKTIDATFGVRSLVARYVP